MNIEEIKTNEASTGRKWRTVKVISHNELEQHAWFKGKRAKRVVYYGTLGNPHKPSRWRVAGYIRKDGTLTDTMSDAMNSFK